MRGTFILIESNKFAIDIFTQLRLCLCSNVFCVLIKKTMLPKSIHSSEISLQLDLNPDE